MKGIHLNVVALPLERLAGGDEVETDILAHVDSSSSIVVFRQANFTDSLLSEPGECLV